MSFDEFIDRPRYEIDIMLKIVNEIDVKKNSINENMLNDIQNTNKDIKPK